MQVKLKSTKWYRNISVPMCAITASHCTRMHITSRRAVPLRREGKDWESIVGTEVAKSSRKLPRAKGPDTQISQLLRQETAEEFQREPPKIKGQGS
jgi:hypothetical protein